MHAPDAIALFVATKKRLAPLTHRTYHYDLARLAAAFPAQDVQNITILELETWLSTLPSGYAHNMAKRLQTFFKWAHTRGLCPAPLAPRSPHRALGFPPWSDHDLAAFRRRWPPGSRPRHIMEAALQTGLRRGDLARLLWAAEPVTGTQKTGAPIYLLPPDLDYGRPMTGWSLGIAFTGWSRAAGLVGRSLHGLRKTAAQRAAMAGCTSHELMALFGWRTLRMAEHYTAGLDRARLAASGRAKLGG